MVLILSEMAGAAVEMTDALLVNPNDTDQIENAIYQALEMPDLDNNGVSIVCKNLSLHKRSNDGPEILSMNGNKLT